MRNVTDNRHVAALIACALLVVPAFAVAQTAGDQTQSLEAIRHAAEAYVRSEAHTKEGATVTAASLDGRLRLARCTSGLHVQLPAGMVPQGRSTVGVSCSSPVHWTVYVPVTLEQRIQVLVLRHAVAQDARLLPQDVSVETRKVSGATAAYLGDTADLKGRSVRRTLAAGTTLTADMLTADLVVRHGQDVTLIAGSGAIEVRAAGRALADAAAGARVRVQNLSSMKVVEGVVEAPDTVRISQ
jgi:flagella basal body P-ring formation protein FlgA